MATSSTLPLSVPRLPNPNSLPLTINNHPTLSLIDQCSDSKQLKQIHAQMLRSGLFFDAFAASKLFTASSLSPFSNMDYALKMFDEIPQPNLYTWNMLIRAHASSAEPVRSIWVFLKMVQESSHYPNKFTFPFVIKAAAGIGKLRVGQAFHAMAVKASFGSDLYVSNSLINCYAECGDFDSAYRVFVMIDEQDVVSWNAMISGFAHNDLTENALDLFLKMVDGNVKPNDLTMLGVLEACGKKSDLEFGKWVCSYIEQNGISSNVTLNNAMLDMFIKCGSMKEAEILFDKTEHKDVVTWTTMLDGYAKLEKFDKARIFFDSMPKKDIVAWNCLISAYEQKGKPNKALAIFNELLLKSDENPDQITFVSALSACSQLGAMELGTWIHSFLKKQNMRLNCHLGTSLIDMYSKCGDLEKAREIFNSINPKDVFVYSSMIAGLAMHGRGNDAIDVFLKMQEDKVKPNSVTFTNVLSACSHTGLVAEGKKFFNEMKRVYGILPEFKHYACMVDVLGRAGHLEEALEFIRKMPIPSNASVWGALLGACRIHGNLALAELACKNILELEPGNHGAYILLSNIYAKNGNWKNVSDLRKIMKESGLKKEPGCSSIEVNGQIHEFLAGDNSHSLSREIFAKLDESMEKLKGIGYFPNKSHILQLVEDENLKEQALSHHSEKLAISFGLITIGNSKPIRVIKNLRVCGDCHAYAKFVSKVYDREILLRDRYRFHHFSKGKCSCMEYW